MLLNCDVGDDSLRVPWTVRRSNQPSWRSVLGVHWKDWCWSWNSNTLATWCEQLIYFKRPWCWERLRAGGEGDERGWDGWIASPTQWTWVWVGSGSWWWAGRPGVLWSMELQRVGQGLSDRTELNWTPNSKLSFPSCSQRWGYPLPGATFANHSNCGGLKQQKFILQSYRLKAWNQGASQSCEEKSVPCLFQHLADASRLWCFLPCEHITAVSVFTVKPPPPLCLCLSPAPAHPFKNACDGTLGPLGEYRLISSSQDPYQRTHQQTRSHLQSLSNCHIHRFWGLAHGCIFGSHHHSEHFPSFCCGSSLSLSIFSYTPCLQLSPMCDYLPSDSYFALSPKFQAHLSHRSWVCSWEIQQVRPQITGSI